MTNWSSFITKQKQQTYLKDTLNTIEAERQHGKIIFPPEQEVFTAFDLTPFDQVKVVILGQDPYHGAGQAHGLSFSVKPGIKPPPSLANMYKELVMDIDDFAIPQHGYLKAWAEQGVLLLNTVLTVEQGQAHSHKHLGWETFTDKVIEELNLHGDKIVFLLWGAHAQKKGKNINTDKHFVLNAPHPSPLSAHRGFFGSKPFSKTNQLLTTVAKKPINWHLD